MMEGRLDFEPPHIEPNEALSPPQSVEVTRTLETANTFPEVIANAPLEETSLIYSVPVMGEWRNGNLLRFLRAMLAQRPQEGEAFELELVINIGYGIDYLIALDEKRDYVRDSQGQLKLDLTPTTKSKQKVLDKLTESRESLDFLRRLIEVQRLARTLALNPKDKQSQDQLDALLHGVSDVLELEVIRLAARRASSISLALVDATHTYLSETNYHHIDLSSLRTVGADIARARFATKPETVLCMYDADTIPENNTAAARMQRLFSDNPDLNYVFTGMANLPAGHSGEFVGDGPRENVQRTALYNDEYSAHGSPQISFRLRAYDKLCELSGTQMSGFHGDEDRDTSYRLIYYFGRLQDGLLLEKSADVYPPTSMTADRLDGSVDSAGRRAAFAKDGTRFLAQDLGHVIDFRQTVEELIASQPPEKRAVTEVALENARQHFERAEKLQQRFNHLILHTFIGALDRGLTGWLEGRLVVREAEIASLPGGDVVLHYIKSNRQLVEQVTLDDVAVMRYYLGEADHLPEGRLTSFQLAIREYVGKVERMDAIMARGLLRGEQVEQPSRGGLKWQMEDLRTPDDLTSLMHSEIAEILALAHIYRTYFEADQFLATRTGPAKPNTYGPVWPDNPDELDYPYSFGDPNERQKYISAMANVQGQAIEGQGRRSGRRGWPSLLRLRGMPLFELFKLLKGGDG